MKVGFLGCGNMGSIYASYLSKKHDVYVYDLSQEVVDAINKNGILLDEANGETVSYRPKMATTNPNDIGPCDLVIVFVKYMFIANALEQAHAMWDDHTMVMSLQNGIGNTDEMAKVVPEDQILCGTTAHGGNTIAPGHIKHAGVGPTNMGSIDPKNMDRVREIAAAMEECGLPANAIEGNPLNLVWHKLFANVVINAQTALLNVQNKFTNDNEYAHDLADKMVREAITAANAGGADFDMEKEVAGAFEVAVKTGDNLSSMLQDVTHERRTEIDIINGAVVKAGKKYGFPTPYNEAIVDLIKAKECTYKK